MDNKTFHYTYSPTERHEIEAIRKKYAVSEEEILAQKIKDLDNKIESSGAIASIVFGVLFTSLFGVGLFLCLAKQMYLLGIILGTIGIIGMGSTPFVNSKFREKSKKKSAKKILALCDEYLKNENK